MNIRQLFTDEEAVSPVIGVILMVAITVILAAVIGTFVLGLGDQVQSTSPQASFNFDFTEDTSGSDYDTLEVTHDGGDSISDAQLSLTSGVTMYAAPGNASGSASSGATSLSLSQNAGGSDWVSDDVTAGTTFAVEGDLAGTTTRVVWSSESGDSSSTLGKWSGPDA